MATYLITNTGPQDDSYYVIIKKALLHDVRRQVSIKADTLCKSEMNNSPKVALIQYFFIGNQSKQEMNDSFFIG